MFLFLFCGKFSFTYFSIRIFCLTTVTCFRNSLFSALESLLSNSGVIRCILGTTGFGKITTGGTHSCSGVVMSVGIFAPQVEILHFYPHQQCPQLIECLIQVVICDSGCNMSELQISISRTVSFSRLATFETVGFSNLGCEVISEASPSCTCTLPFWGKFFMFNVITWLFYNVIFFSGCSSCGAEIISEASAFCTLMLSFPLSGLISTSLIAVFEMCVLLLPFSLDSLLQEIIAAN